MRRQSKASLEWTLRYGHNLKFLEGLCEEEPSLVSDEFKRRPRLEDWQIEILDAFTLLSRGRSYGFASEQPISTADMVAMISVNPAVRFIEAIQLIHIWRTLDELCLAHWAEKRKAVDKKPLEKS